MIHVIAEITVREGQRDAFVKAFTELVPEVLKEEGCLEYGPTLDVALNVSEAPRADVVTIVEKWESVLALETHLVAPHMVQFRQASQHMTDGVRIRVLQPAQV